MSSAADQDRDDVIAAAAHWAALVDTGEMTATERAACEEWCSRDPRHRRTFERMLAFDGMLDDHTDPPGSAVDALPADRKWHRRRLGSAVLSAALVALGAWQAARADWVRDHFPDYRTVRGEQQRIVLEEGSAITLDTDGAVRVDFDGERRRVRLIGGQIFAEVGRDPGRPFVVETAQGTVTALGTAFTVRRADDRTIVSVVRSAVRVCPRDGGAGGDRCRTLGPAERATMSASRVGPITAGDPEAAISWTRGWLVADDEPVADVLVELGRYAPRQLVYDAAELRGLRVTGSFPLTDVDRAVDGVARSARLTVQRSATGEVTIRRD